MTLNDGATNSNERCTPPKIPCMNLTTVVQISREKRGKSAIDPLIAQGAFGRVDIALLVGWRLLSSQAGATINCVSLAAIKTIPNAITPNQLSHQQQPVSLTREAVAELNTLRLLNGHENVTPLIGYYGAQDSFSGYSSKICDLDFWKKDNIHNTSCPTSLCLIFPYHPIDLNEALNYRRCNPSNFSKSDFTLSMEYFHLPQNVVKSVMYDILSALHHLHSHHILHQDVKPGNFYITNDGRIQLGDFGLAKIVPLGSKIDCSKSEKGDFNFSKSGSQAKGLCTLQYRPPEMLLGGTGIIHRSDSSSSSTNGAFDIWSVGCIYAELLTLSGPLFPGRSVLDQLGRIFTALGTPNEENWPGVGLLPDWNKVIFERTDGIGLQDVLNRKLPPVALELISELLTLDPLRRASAEQGLRHLYFQSFICNCEDDAWKRHARQAVQSTLVPSHLHVADPIYFTPNDFESITHERDPLAYSKEYAAKTAHSRRNFMTSMNSSQEKEIRSTQRWSIKMKANGLMEELDGIG